MGGGEREVLISSADGLDDAAVVLAHLVGEEGEMLAHQAIGSGVAGALATGATPLPVTRDGAGWGVRPVGG